MNLYVYKYHPEYGDEPVEVTLFYIVLSHDKPGFQAERFTEGYDHLLMKTNISFVCYGFKL